MLHQLSHQAPQETKGTFRKKKTLGIENMIAEVKKVNIIKLRKSPRN